MCNDVPKMISVSVSWLCPVECPVRWDNNVLDITGLCGVSLTVLSIIYIRVNK